MVEEGEGAGRTEAGGGRSSSSSWARTQASSSDSQASSLLLMAGPLPRSENNEITQAGQKGSPRRFFGGSRGEGKVAQTWKRGAPYQGPRVSQACRHSEPPTL